MSSERFLRNLVLSLVGIAGASALAGAQTATQTVTFAVNAINQVSITGAPSLTITTAVAGSQPTSVTDASSIWAVTTNQTGAKVSANITTGGAMPAGLTLKVNLTTPGAPAVSNGQVTLGVAAVDLVTGITKTAVGSLSATYQLDATAAAGVVTSSTRVVTYTLSGGT